MIYMNNCVNICKYLKKLLSPEVQKTGRNMCVFVIRHTGLNEYTVNSPIRAHFQ